MQCLERRHRRGRPTYIAIGTACYGLCSLLDFDHWKLSVQLQKEIKFALDIGGTGVARN